MAKWSFIHALLAGIAAASVFAGALEAEENAGMDHILSNLTSPMEYEIVDVTNMADSTVHLKFAFNVPTELKSPTEVGGKLSLVLQSPVRLEFVKDAYKFEKSDETWETLVGKRTPDVRTEEYKRLAKTLTRGKCSRDTLVKLFVNELADEYKTEMGFHTEDSKILEKMDTSKNAKALAVPISIHKDVASIAAGVYTWTGIFKCRTNGTFSGEIPSTFEDWILALIVKDGKKPKGFKNVCFNRDSMSAKAFFENLDSSSMVLKCNGRVEFDNTDKNLDMFYVNMVPTAEVVDKKGSGSLISFSFVFKSKNYMAKVLGDSILIKIFLPEADKMTPTNKLVKEDFVDKFAEDLTGTEEVSEENINLNAKGITVVDYDNAKRVVVLDVASAVKLAEDKTYFIHFLIGDLRGKIADKGYWRFQIATHTYARLPPSVSLLKDDLSKLELTKFGEKVVKSDETHTSCMEMITDTYVDLMDVRSADNTVIVSMSEPMYTDLTTNLPTVTGRMGMYAPSKYMLTLKVDATTNIEDTKGYLVVKFPESGASYDGKYFDTNSNTVVSLPESYSYEEATKTLKIAMDFIETPEPKTKNAYGYVVPIPFTPLTDIKNLLDVSKWNIDILDASSKSTGISSLKFDLSKDIMSTEKNKSGLKDGYGISIADYHHIEEDKNTLLTVSLDAVIFKNMFFTFKFSKKMLDSAACNVSVLNHASTIIKTTCSSEGDSVEIYIDNAENFIGIMERITFTMKLDAAFLAGKAKETLEITGIGATGGSVKKIPYGSAKAHFDGFSSNKTNILEETIALKDIRDAKTNAINSCLSKSSRVLSIPFDGETRGVYYMTRLHNCEKPWLSGDLSTPSEAFTFNLEASKTKTLGKTTVHEVLRLSEPGKMNSMVEENSMRSKHFMEHTLYIVFDKVAVTTLCLHMIAAKKCTKEDAACKAGGELLAIDMFVEELAKVNKSTIVGDIHYGYYDEAEKSLVLKRKALFEESKNIKNKDRIIADIKTYKAAIERILDDGFVHVVPELMTESFSVLVFADPKNSKLLKKELTFYATPKKPSDNNGKLLHPIIVKVYDVTDNFKVKENADLCGKSVNFYTPFVKSTKDFDETFKGPEVLSYLNDASTDDEMYNKFSFTSVAAKLSDTKVNPTVLPALKGADDESKRLPKRDAFEVFFNFEELNTPICVAKGEEYTLKFEELVGNFISYVRRTVATGNVIFASCVKFETTEAYESRESKYTLAYNGIEFAKADDSDKKSLPKVNGKCHLYSLYENMPRTLHYDETVDYKVNTKSKSLEKPVVLVEAKEKETPVVKDPVKAAPVVKTPAKAAPKTPKSSFVGLVILD